MIASPDEPGKSIAIEGNRRLAAIKVLRNPSILAGMDVRAPIQKRFEELAADFDAASLPTLDCFQGPAREEGAMWINPATYRGERGARDRG